MRPACSASSPPCEGGSTDRLARSSLAFGGDARTSCRVSTPCAEPEVAAAEPVSARRVPAGVLTVDARMGSVPASRPCALAAPPLRSAPSRLSRPLHLETAYACSYAARTLASLRRFPGLAPHRPPRRLPRGLFASGSRVLSGTLCICHRHASRAASPPSPPRAPAHLAAKASVACGNSCVPAPPTPCGHQGTRAVDQVQARGAPTLFVHFWR